MTYAIGYFVYGVKVDESVWSEENEGFIDANLTTQYSGGGEQPLYFGIDIGEIDECTEYQWSELAVFHSKVTDDLIADFEKKRAAILADPELPEELRPYLLAPASLFLTWGSS